MVAIKNPANNLLWHKKYALKPYFHWFQGMKKARDGTRTRGLDLGKVALHQLSHSRISVLFSEVLCFPSSTGI